MLLLIMICFLYWSQIFKYVDTDLIVFKILITFNISLEQYLLSIYYQ